METVSKERNAIQISKEFLRKQRQSLKRRQAALQAAKQELTRDVVRQKQGVGYQFYLYPFPILEDLLQCFLLHSEVILLLYRELPYFCLDSFKVVV